MTSLKEQLNKLSDAHTKWQLTETENRKRASFLYDPKEAASLDRETIYCLGCNGFEALCSLDPTFEEFERVLFSDTSLNFERSIQSKEVNDSLNITIQRFLVRLSPYFLLSPAHKALEWLVHRFFIHFYNVDDLMRCILPYHEHNYFVRAIQMIRLNEKNSAWSWLESSQKAGTTIPGLVMANHCATDFGFLTFICESMVMAVKEFGNKSSSLRVMINFYVKTLCSAILHSLSQKKKKKKKSSVDETFVAHLMPYLLKGFKSKCVDYKRASYLILSHLSNIFTFQPTVRDEILNVMSKGFTDDLIKENLLILAVFLSNQHSPSMPDRCLTKLTEIPKIVDEIEQLSIDVRIDEFLCAWFEQLLKHLFAETNEQEAMSNLMEKTLNQIKFNSNVLKFIINSFIEHFNSKNEKSLVSFASIIERKYPIDFDDNIREQTENCPNDEKRKRIREFASMTAIGFKHQPLSDRTSLAICLNHPQSQLRIEALQRLRQGLQSKQKIEKEFLVEVLLNRLNDNDPEVVKEAIDLLEETKFVNQPALNDLLEKLLQRDEDQWRHVQRAILRYFSSHSSNEHRFVHLLFPSNSNEFQLFNEFLDQNKSSLTPLMKLAKKTFKGSSINAETMELFLRSIGENVDRTKYLSAIFDQSEEILRLMESNRSNSMKFSVIFILLGLEVINDEQIGEFAIRLIFKLLEKLCKEVSISADPSNTLIDRSTLIENHLMEKKVLSKSSCRTLSHWFIQRLPRAPRTFNGWKEFLVQLIQWLAAEENLSFIHLLLAEQFPSINDLMIFFAENFLSRSDLIVEQEIFVKYFAKKSSTNDFQGLTILIAVFLLQSNSRTIRSNTMKIFGHSFPSFNEPFDTFLQSIKRHQTELISDPEYITVLISQHLQTMKLGEKKKRKINEEKSSFIHFLKTLLDDNEELHGNFKEQINLHLLRLLKNVQHWSIFDEYRPELLQLLPQSAESIEKHRTLIEEILRHIDYPTITHDQSECFSLVLQLVQRAMKKSKSNIFIDLLIIVFNQFTTEMFAALSFDQQNLFLDQSFALWSRSKSSQLTTTIQTTLSKFHFDAKHFLNVWKIILEPEEKQTIPISNKKLLISKTTPNETSPTTAINWKLLFPSFEFFHQDQLHIEHQDQLIKPLFSLLEKSLNQSEEFEQRTYLHQLILTALLNLYSRVKSDQCHAEAFNSEILMECLKRTNDLHTTQQCLMLLSKGAQLFPEKLISMIMAMFAFVGDRLVRKDDLYSYQVMEKTIKTVIPSLYKEKNVEQSRPILAKITHVFVTSLAHLPAHRRQDIFRMLIESIGEEECLWFTPIQLFDSVLLSPINRKNEETLKKSLMEASEQMIQSFSQFSSITIFINLTKILNVLLNLPDQISKNSSTPNSYSHLIDLRPYTTKHIHVFKYQLLTFVSNILSAEFFMKMVKKNHSNEKQFQHLNEMIQTILHCLLWANKLSEDDADIPRYNKSILNKIYECLNKSMALLHGSMFVQIISNLLDQQANNEKLQRKTLEIFNARLKEDWTNENDILPFLPQIDRLFVIMKKFSTHEQEQTAQTALFTVKLLAKRLAEKHPQEFSSPLTFLCDQLRSIDSAEHPNLNASIYLCLAELCSTLKVYSIGELPNFMPHVIETYQSDRVMRHEMLLTSVIASISKLVRTLCNYLTPYLPSIIKRTCTLLTHPLSSNDQRLRTMWSHLALHVPHRLLFPIFYDVIEKNEFQLNDLEPLMTLFKQSLSNATLDDLSRNYSLLKQLFLRLFTLRATHSKKMPPHQMNVYEDHVFDCFSELVVRLSEETFRPLFYAIYEWAVYNEPPAEYTLTFYRLTFALSKKLKGLFTLFAGHIIQHAANLLDQLNTSKTEKPTEFPIQFRKKHAEENHLELLNGVLGTLATLCLFDSVGFITDERFQLLMTPIVDQLENFTNKENYLSWIEESVTPCIVHLTSATKEESLWRQIHYQILLKTRSNLSKVRLACLHVLREMSRKLAVNYQSLLAEAIPFLAELMDDANDEVEKTAHRLISDMESTLGESLQDYFNN